VVITLSTWLGLYLSQGQADGCGVRFGVGIMLAVLLLARRERWVPLLLTATVATVATQLVFIGCGVVSSGTGQGGVAPLTVPRDAIASVVLDGVTANAGLFLAAWILRRGRRRIGDISHPRALIELAQVGLLVEPLLSTAVLVAARRYLLDMPAMDMLAFAKRSILSDMLGIAVMTPLTLSLIRGEMASLLAGDKVWRFTPLVALHCIVSFAVFYQNQLPLLFVPFPTLLLLASGFGMAAAGLGLLAIALTAMGFTLAGHGPVALVANQAGFDPVSFVAFYLLVTAAMAFPVASLISLRTRLVHVRRQQHDRLSQTALRYRLLADYCSDIITRTQLDGTRVYVSPSAQTILGLPPSALMAPGWHELIHPDDRPGFIRVRERMRAGADQVTNVYRMRTSTGEWAWLEGRVTLVRDARGAPLELIAIHRDVTRQKRTELELETAVHELSEQASTDGLTGLANRRAFDIALDREWRHAARVGAPLSLLMIDVDHFKKFNDRYGHQAGDDCLRAVADCVLGNIRRPRDLLARYGGEEFVVILPATTVEGADGMAHAIQRAVNAEVISHSGSPDGHVTVSIGVACSRPMRDGGPALLVEAADSALYAAKRNGRNRVESGMLRDSQTALPAE
jgi:diguanylate cyclase (GGDEF)-like protein/PAS domain S-box-containing protein